MSEMIKDSAIKLFGQTISLPPDKGFIEAHHLQHQQSFSSSISSTSCDNTKSDSEEDLSGTKQEDVASKPAEETSVEPTTPSDITSDPETSDKDSLSPKQPCNTDEPSESGVSQEKTPPKKPDKIIPCPRCKSMDTKFCYYNNYNVNQPRHFCRICQRYWTAGGTMRNVPVGSGRRKNKNAFASNYSHFIVSDPFQTAQAIPISGMQLPSKQNGTLLMFGDRVNGQETKNPVHHERRELVNPQSIPMMFYPSLPSSWNMPFLSTPCTLGKRSNDGNLVRQPNMVQSANVSDNSSERCVLVPKTLRFDDPNVTAMSSIWSSLGIKPEKMDPTVGIFATLPAKGNRNNHVDGASLVLQANPAAMSRSLNFRESV